MSFLIRVSFNTCQFLYSDDINTNDDITPFDGIDI
jgi:hypothetical protein